MQFFPIKNFRPIEAKEDATDQDRTIGRVCDGLLPVPQGALCSGPIWKTLWGLDDLADQAETLLAAASATHAHFLRLARGNRVFLVVWSRQALRALGFFEVTPDPDDDDFDSTGAVSLTAPNGADWRDKDPDAQWYASPDAGRFILGNGVNGNLVWSGGALALLGPAATPTSPYDLARLRIPPCTSFVRHVNGSLFATGNPTNPLRVWITAAPNASYPYFDGVQSLSTSFIDVRPNNGATRAIALSVYQQYVTVHTDRAPVNVYGVDNTADGWKCEQAPSAANASAMNPACVCDTEGSAAYYFGRDLEIYRDEAVRSGPNEKRAARDQEIVTTQGVGVWNRDMVRPPAAYGYAMIHDRTSRLFWVFARSTFDDRGMVWLYNERTRACAGPIHYPDAVSICSVMGRYAMVVTFDGVVLYADLAAVGEQFPDQVDARGAALGADFVATVGAPTPSPGMPIVGLTADRRGWIEQLGASTIGFANPFAHVTEIAPGSLTITDWFKDAHIARFETGLLDFGAPGTLKEYIEVLFTFERNSRAYLLVCAQTDDGLEYVRYKGLVFDNRRPVRVPLKCKGAKIRLRFVLVVFNRGRLLLRDARIGWNPAGDT